MNDATRQGSTPLHLAMAPPSGYPNVALVKLLIAKGVDPAAKNNLGQTAEDELRQHAARLMLRQELALVPIENDVYAKVANEVLQLLRPGAPAILQPKAPEGEWKTLDFGYMSFRRRIFSAGGETVLEMQFKPFQEETTVRLSQIYLDQYECDEPDPVTFHVKAGEPYDLHLHFSPAAGQKGFIDFRCEVKNRSGVQPGFIDQSNSGEPVGPIGGTPEYMVIGVNDSFSTRDVEVRPVALSAKGKSVPLLSTAVMRVAAGSKKGFDSVVPKGIGKFTLKYRWRLLPNRRWRDARWQPPF